MPVNSPKIRQSPRLKNDFSKNILKSDGVKRNLLEAIKDVDSDGCHEKKSSSQTRATPNKVTTSLTRKSIRQRYSSVKFKPAPRSLGGRSTRKKVDSSTSDDSR